MLRPRTKAMRAERCNNIQRVLLRRAYPTDGGRNTPWSSDTRTTPFFVEFTRPKGTLGPPRAT